MNEYYLFQDKTPTGPFTDEELEVMYRDGKIDGNTPCSIVGIGGGVPLFFGVFRLGQKPLRSFFPHFRSPNTGEEREHDHEPSTAEQRTTPTIEPTFHQAAGRHSQRCVIGVAVILGIVGVIIMATCGPMMIDSMVAAREAAKEQRDIDAERKAADIAQAEATRIQNEKRNKESSEAWDFGYGYANRITDDVLRMQLWDVQRAPSNAEVDRLAEIQWNNFLMSTEGSAWAAWTNNRNDYYRQTELEKRWRAGFEDGFLGKLKPIIEENRRRAAPAF